MSGAEIIFVVEEDEVDGVTQQAPSDIASIHRAETGTT